MTVPLVPQAQGQGDFRLRARAFGGTAHSSAWARAKTEGTSGLAPFRFWRAIYHPRVDFHGYGLLDEFHRQHESKLVLN